MKGDTEVIVGVVLFFAGVAFGVFMGGGQLSSFWQNIAAPGATLIAAYVGARLAFQYQQRFREDESRRKKIAAGNLAAFELTRSFNKFIRIEDQFISELRNHPARHILIMPVMGQGWTAPDFDYGALAFLFRSSNPNFLGRLSLIQHEIESTNEVIRHRSQIHVERVQPAVERIEKFHGEKIPVDLVESELGTRDTAMIKMSTEQMIQGVDDVVDGTRKLCRELNALLREMFPGEPLLRLKNDVNSEGGSDAARA